MPARKHAPVAQTVADARLLYTDTTADKLVEAQRRPPTSESRRVAVALFEHVGLTDAWWTCARAVVASAATKVRGPRTRANGARALGMQVEAAVPPGTALAVISRRAKKPAGQLTTRGHASEPVAATPAASNKMQHDAGASTRQQSTISGGTSTCGLGFIVPGLSERPVRSRFAVEDTAGTRQAIQHEWKQGMMKKDVLSACARIDAFLDNPLLASDEDRAAVTLQSVTRGWLLRRARKAGAVLFPVEAQALADGRVLIHKGYGGRVYSLGPSQRRSMVNKHFAASKIQRAWLMHWSATCARLQAEDSCISLAAEDSLLNVAPRVIGSDLACANVAAVKLLQRAMRMYAARKCCRRMRLRLSKAVNFLPFLSTDLAAATMTAASLIKDAAAMRVQSFWRGASCRQRLKGKQLARARAALLLQRHARGWSSRRKMAQEQSLLLRRLLLKRVVRWWNKIMWTVYSPGKVGRENVGNDGGNAAGTGWYGAISRSGETLPGVGISEGVRGEIQVSQASDARDMFGAARTLATPIASGQLGCVCDEDGSRKLSSAHVRVQATEENNEGLRVNDTPARSQTHPHPLLCPETPRRSWQIVESTGTSTRDCKEDSSTGTAHLPSCCLGNQDLDTMRWPETYSSSICLEAGALKQGDGHRR